MWINKNNFKELKTLFINVRIRKIITNIIH